MQSAAKELVCCADSCHAHLKYSISIVRAGLCVTFVFDCEGMQHAHSFVDTLQAREPGTIMIWNTGMLSSILCADIPITRCYTAFNHMLHSIQPYAMTYITLGTLCHTACRQMLHSI